MGACKPSRERESRVGTLPSGHSHELCLRNCGHILEVVLGGIPLQFSDAVSKCRLNTLADTVLDLTYASTDRFFPGRSAVVGFHKSVG
jgi:hypothetical protein